MKRLFTLAAAAMLVLAGCDPDDTEITTLTEPTPKPAPVPLAAVRQTRLYDVTIENLTNAQPFSPGVVVTHTSALDVFTVGQTASAGVKAVAEAGNEAPLAGALQGAAGAGNVMRISTPTVPMNFPAGNPKPNRTTVRITAPPGSDRLSVVTMLTCTNDGFTGVDAVQLPMDTATVTFTEKAYDARAEVNNERSPFIVPGCSAFGPVNLPIDGNALAPETGVIVEHPGIQGNADIPVTARWTNPVIRVTVKRVRI
jgi:hypothetical protein